MSYWNNVQPVEHLMILLSSTQHWHGTRSGNGVSLLYCNVRKVCTKQVCWSPGQQQQRGEVQET